jgi:hypothetical protein
MKAILADPAVKKALLSRSPTSRQSQIMVEEDHFMVELTTRMHI